MDRHQDRLIRLFQVSSCGFAPEAIVQESVPHSMPIGSLVPADSPRLDGVSEMHARALAEVDTPLPAIVVHRPSMRVIDGMHRLRAAQLRGSSTIEVRFFDGGEDQAFVIAVEANIKHGMPLSLADREAAAARIISSFPEWSDRAVATATGLSAKTVATIRRSATAGLPRLHARIGRDGRVRPLNSAEGRRTASRMIAQHPDASLRQIAAVAGISIATVRDVRERMRQGRDPVPPKVRAMATNDTSLPTERPARHGECSVVEFDKQERISILEHLRKDPSLRYTESGRLVLRWLHTHVMALDDYEKVAAELPLHWIEATRRLALHCSSVWNRLAEELEYRSRMAELG